MRFPEKFGVLEHVKCVSDDGYYKLIRGRNRNYNYDERYLVTRGPGKEKAATRIPIRISDDLAKELATINGAFQDEKNLYMLFFKRCF